MGVQPEDFIEVKSIVTALGYRAKSSVATIKTNKKISALENEYMKMRSNKSKFESVCVTFPNLAAIDSFSTGLLTILNSIVAHLNRNIHEFEDEETLIRKIVEQGEKVNNLFIHSVNICVNNSYILISFTLKAKIAGLTEDNVMIVKNSNGLAFKVRCVNCTDAIKLSYSRNATSEKISFSFFNYTRHYEKHNESIPSNQKNSLQTQAPHESNCNETQYSEFMQITECVKNTTVVTSTPKTVPEIFEKLDFVHQSNRMHQKDISMPNSHLRLGIEKRYDEYDLTDCKECDGLKMQLQECIESAADCKNQLKISQENTEEMKIELEKKSKMS